MAQTQQSASPAPADAPTVESAARDVYNALVHIGPARLGHGYGCPSEHAGPCTCGTAELATAVPALKDALDAGTPP